MVLFCVTEIPLSVVSIALSVRIAPFVFSNLNFRKAGE